MPAYAVKWREPDGQRFVGRLSFGAAELRLDGRTLGPEGRAVTRQFGYDELRGPRLGSRPVERLDGRPAVVVDGPDGCYLIASVGMGAPVVQELVDRLADVRVTARGRATVALPLREGSLDRVRELIAKGPPFDPSETPLTRHELLLTPCEAIFVFEATTASGLLMLLTQLDVWDAVAAWGELVAGPPRLAEVVYAWARADDATDARSPAPNEPR